VVYSIQDIRQLLSIQPEDTKRWLTTSQMGWALTREENELVNEKDEREGKPVARQLAPMISKFIRAQWESEGMENVDDERRQLLEEAMELDHIWGVWEGEKEPTDVHQKWIRQPSQSGNDMRHHVRVHASHREQEWESPSASLIEQDPEVIPDVDIAAQVGKDFFLDEKIPRHESGQGYVRVVEQSIMWRETETAKVFTYQGLTTCTELDKSWTVMSSIYNHLRQGRDKSISELKLFIRAEVELQERLETMGYRSPTWRLLRALQSLLSAVQLQGESAVTAPPFFPSAGRGTTNFWGKRQGPTVFLWEGLDEGGREECEKAIRTGRDWVVWSRARPAKGDCKLRGFEQEGNAVFQGKVKRKKKAHETARTEDEAEHDAPEDEVEGGGRACRQKGWWKRGDVEAKLNTVNMTAWVHRECDVIEEEAITKLQEAWDSSEQKDECIVRLNDLEGAYWMGTEIGQLGGYGFQGVTLGVDGSCKDGRMGSGCCEFGEKGEGKCVRVGREDEGTSSNRPELGGVVLALQSAALNEDALLLCDNEAVLRVIRKWVGQGGKATLATAPDADILREIICLLTQRVRAGRATFLIKVKSHRGEPINERADTLAEEGRTISDDDKRWDDRTDRMTFEVQKGDTTVRSVWTNSVRNAFRKQAGWAKLQKVRATAATHWTARVWYRHNQRWLQASKEGAEASKSGSFKDERTWGRKCFEDLDQRRMGRPATSTWSTDFLLREGSSREEIGKWLKNKSIPWQRRRRLLQVVTGTFPCGQQLVKYGYKEKAECILCKKAYEENGGSWKGVLPKETIGHIQSAGCLGQKEVVTAAHNAQFCSKDELWEAAKEEEMKIPWKEAQEGLPVPEDQYQERFWRRRLDGIGLDTVNKEFLAIEFKRTQDMRSNYAEEATKVAQKQYSSLLEGLRAVGQVKGWQTQQLVFVGGACGSVHVESFNKNMKALGVLESKWNPIRQKLVRRLLEEQDKVLRSYFAQKGGTRGQRGGDTHGQGRDHVKWDILMYV
jgi:ribonuclease HI